MAGVPKDQTDRGSAFAGILSVALGVYRSRLRGCLFGPNSTTPVRA